MYYNFVREVHSSDSEKKRISYMYSPLVQEVRTLESCLYLVQRLKAVARRAPAAVYKILSLLPVRPAVSRTCALRLPPSGLAVRWMAERATH